MENPLGVKISISPDNEHIVMLKTLFSLYVQFQVVESILLDMYAKTKNLTKEEASKQYDELIEKSNIESVATFSKFGDLKIL